MRNLLREFADKNGWVCRQTATSDFTVCGTSLDNEDYGFIETNQAVSCERCIAEINNCKAAKTS